MSVPWKEKKWSLVCFKNYNYLRTALQGYEVCCGRNMKTINDVAGLGFYVIFNHGRLSAEREE